MLAVVGWRLAACMCGHTRQPQSLTVHVIPAEKYSRDAACMHALRSGNLHCFCNSSGGCMTNECSEGCQLTIACLDEGGIGEWESLTNIHHRY